MVYADGKAYCVDLAGGLIGVLGKSWTLPLIGVLGNRARSRFNEIQDAIAGIGTKVLAERLKEAIALGLVERTVYPEVPVRVEYRLTPAGTRLRQALVPLLAWAATNPPPVRAEPLHAPRGNPRERGEPSPRERGSPRVHRTDSGPVLSSRST